VFNQDRLENPEFFCWPGYWLAAKGTAVRRSLWLKHQSLFSDKADDDALFARMFPGREKEAVMTAFNQFFAAIMLYDLTKQLVLDEGPFKLHFSWLTSSHRDPEFLAKVNELFRNLYGRDLDQVNFVERPNF
jgi:hypothetical protein